MCELDEGRVVSGGVLKMKIGRAREEEAESTIKLALAFQEILKGKKKCLSLSSAQSSIHPTNAHMKQ